MVSRLNWRVWAALVLSLVALVSYPLVFVRWPLTRDVPWVNFGLFAVATALVVAGLRRAFATPGRWVGKAAAAAATLLSAAALVSFVYVVIIAPRRLPASSGAPQVGQRAPDFTLVDTDKRAVSLAELLSTPIPSAAAAGPGAARPPRGTLLIFYRGYW
jgi:hypothetical protein